MNISLARTDGGGINPPLIWNAINGNILNIKAAEQNFGLAEEMDKLQSVMSVSSVLEK